MVPIAAICCTFGRVRFLEEQVESFLRQDYEGSMELIIFNTLDKQTIKFDHPNVRVINARQRPETMGETRNQAIEYANENALIVTWDDDDIILSNYLTTLTRGFDSTIHGWTRHDKQLYREGLALRGFTHGTANTFAFLKLAWRSVGGYSRMNCGEDRNFISKVTSAFQGNTVSIREHEVGYVYRWGQGAEVYHLSGKGDDEPNQPTGMFRSYRHVMDQIGALREPVGEVELKPKWHEDYEEQARRFAGAVVDVKAKRRGNVGIVCLGHYGDIMNCLPIARRISRAWKKPLFFTCQQYADILDGVSYVVPQVLIIANDSVKEAVKIAHQRCEYVLCLQRYGVGHAPDHVSESYNTDQWQTAGMLDMFCKERLVFDRMDMDWALKADEWYHNTDKPLIAVHLTGGHSSPFSHGKAMLDWLITEHGEKFEIVNLDKVKAGRIYNISSLLDICDILISSDTYPLHLACASNVPVIALVNDGTVPFRDKWLQTELRYKPALMLGYSHAWDDRGKISEVLNSIPAASEKFKYEPIYPLGRMFHCVQIHPGVTDGDKARKHRARASWQKLYSDHGVIPVHVTADMLKRDATNIGDRPLPYLVDVLLAALSANPRATTDNNDVIIWTNDDIVLHPLIVEALRLHLSIWGACTSKRCEFRENPMPQIDASPEEMASKSSPHCGRDLFAATVPWLREHIDQLGDYILGAPLFDLALASIVRKSKGFTLNRANLEEIIPPCELPMGYVLHEAHGTSWDRDTPARRHNSRLFQEWAGKYMPELKFTPEGNI